MNFNSLNKIFEDKFTISKNLLREEASLKSKKQKQKKNLIESMNKSLNERNWKLTIPGSFRDEMMDAGEEEDFDRVRNILIDICNYVLEHIDESDFDLDDQEYVIEEFEEFAEELEYVDLEDEDEANYYLNDLYDLLDNTDIFLGLSESLNEKKVTGGNMEQEDINLIEPFINFLDDLENNYKDVCMGITWNFGRRKSDNKMTAGVDVYLKGDFDNEDSEDYWLKKDEELLDRIRDYLPEYGFRFDDSLGYDSNPWKEHMFGDGYHTQIIEDVIEECLNEEYEDVNLSDYEYVGNVDGFSTYRKIITDENGETRGVWAAQDQNEKEPPFKITYDQALGHEPIKDTHGIKKLSRDLGRILLPQNESLNESNEEKPNKEQFIAYCIIQHSGITNMFNVDKVIEASDYVLDIPLTEENILYIYSHYSELLDEYHGFNPNMFKSEIYDVRDSYGMSTDDYDECLTEDAAKKVYWVTFSFGDYSHESTTVYANKKSEVKKILQNQYGKDVKIHSIELNESLTESAWNKRWDFSDIWYNKDNTMCIEKNENGAYVLRKIKNGGDTKTIAGPFSTLDKAKEAAEEIKKKSINEGWDSSRSYAEYYYEHPVSTEELEKIVKKDGHDDDFFKEVLNDLDSIAWFYNEEEESGWIEEPDYFDDYDENESLTESINPKFKKIATITGTALDEFDIYSEAAEKEFGFYQGQICFDFEDIELEPGKKYKLDVYEVPEEFWDEYGVDDESPYWIEINKKSLNESWVLFFDEDGRNHAGSDGAHKFNLSPKNIERKIKSSDYHLPNWANSYIILSDSEFNKMDYDEIEKYHKRYGKTLNEDTVKQDGKWVNKGKEGTHGKFKTKKEADAQRKAMFANGYKG